MYSQAEDPALPDPRSGPKDTGCISWGGLRGPARSTAAWICVGTRDKVSQTHFSTATRRTQVSRKQYFQGQSRELCRRQDRTAVYPGDSCGQASWLWPAAHIWLRSTQQTFRKPSSCLYRTFPTTTKCEVPFLPPGLGSEAPVRNRTKPADLRIQHIHPVMAQRVKIPKTSS